MKEPYLDTSADWLHQSSLLLTAYPTTTRTITKYSIVPPPSASKLSKKRKRGEAETQPPEEAHKSMQPRAYITLKTFEPESGICFKYRTDKEREVGRLIANLGKLGRGMAALPVDSLAEGAGEVERAVGVGDMVEDAGASAPQVASSGGAATGGADGSAGVGGSASAGGGGGGGGKKKKKGKK